MTANPRDAISRALDQVRNGLRKRLVTDTAVRLSMGAGIWMLASFIIDRGLFGALTFDLAEHLPGWVRWGQTLVLALLGLVFVLSRLHLITRSFSDADMALALERKFGKQLGDRLITAVELGNPAAKGLGDMSKAMVEATRSEAAKEIESLPLNQVFDSARPRRQVFALSGILMGGYLGLMAFFAACVADGVNAYHDSAWFWVERTVLGRDVYWPRNAFLRLAGFPSNGAPLRVGRGSSLQFRVEAHRLIVAGPPGKVELEACRTWLAKANLGPQERDAAWEIFASSSLHGWRPATIFDVVRFSPPAGWNLPGPDGARLPRRGEIPGAIDTLLDRAPEDPLLIAAADSLSAASHSFFGRRSVRSLGVPAMVEWLETAKTVREDGKHARQTIEELPEDQREPGVYIRPFQHLVDSLEIIARAGNFQTRSHDLEVLPPPVLARLNVTEHRPAYLSSRVDALLDGQARTNALAELAAKRVEVPSGDRLMPRAEASVVEFPNGSELSLEFALQEGRIPGDRPTLESLNGRLPTHSIRETDGQSFVVEIGTLREERVVLLRFSDADGIAGSRKIVLRPLPDSPPTLEARPIEDLRETESGFLVTARTRVPFMGSARDDHGLGVIRQAWTTREIDRDGAAGSMASRLAHLLAPEPSSRLPAALNLAASMASLRKGPQAIRLSGAIPLLAMGDLAALIQFGLPFSQGTSGLSLPRRRVVGPFAKRLGSLKDPETVRSFALEPDVTGSPPGIDFPLPESGIEVDPAGSVNRGRRFLVELMLEAEDLDLSGDPAVPHIARAGPFSLVVVPDDEMLELIQADEMRLRERLLEMRNELVPPDLGQRTPIRYLLDVSALPGDLREATNRLDVRRSQAEQIDRVLDDARRKAEEIERDFRRLTRQTGLCGFPVKDEKEKVAKALERIHKEAIPAVRGSVEGFRKQADSGDAVRATALRTCKQRSAELIGAIDEALNLMGGASDFDSEVARLRGILREQENQTRRLDAFRKELVNKLLEDLLNPK